MPVLHLVRHGRSRPVSGTPPQDWSLHPEATAGLCALADAKVLSADAVWVSSPEPKAMQTAEALRPAEFSSDDGLREAVRPAHWYDDLGEFEGMVRRSFADPEHCAAPGWEPLRQTGNRVLAAVHALLDAHEGRDLVLVGHGTAWTLVVAAMTAAPPDLTAWAAMRMPDHAAVDVTAGRLVWHWGDWASSGTLNRS